MKKYRFEFIFGMLYSLFSVLIITVSNNFNYGVIKEIDELVKLVFSSLIGLITIWISGYFILIQLYKNSYPMEIIERKFLKTVKRILIFSGLNIFMGMFIITKFNNYINETYYLIIFTINMIIIFYKTYMINRTFTINTYIDNFYKKLSNELKKNNTTEKVIDNTFKEFCDFFDDCIVKDEYYVCNNISKKTGELFRELIEYCNKMVIEGKEDIAEYLFDKIVNYGIYQVINSKNSKSPNFISDLFVQQAKNINICIKIDRLEWFKKYVKNINLLIKEYQDNENNVLEEISYMNVKIAKELMNKDSSWMEWFINQLYNMNISLKYAYKNINLSYYCKVISYILITYIENKEKDNEKYKILIDNLKRFTIELTRVNDNIQDMVINYSIYGNKLLENKDISKIEDFIEVLTQDENRLINEDKWNEFVLYYLNISLEKYPEKLAEKNRKKIIDIIISLSLNDSNIKYYSFLPEYDKIICDNKYNSKAIEQICEEFVELLTRLIINNNVKMYYLTLKLLKDSIIKLEKSDKNIQEKIFDIFILMLMKSLNTENKKFAELTISTLDECVENLDKEKKISDDFGDYIIEKISDIAMYRTNITEINAIEIVNLLAGFLEEGKEYNFISRKVEKKKLLYKNIYNIGINSIENNMENSVRNVSNTLGWFIIASIKNDAVHLTNYLIERTVDLFKIAKNMEVTEKTLTFIMTLFTTVGTYCCKEPKDIVFLEKILDILKEENLIRIKTAIELRTKENNMWDKLFEGNTQILTGKFLSKITEISNKK